MIRRVPHAPEELLAARPSTEDALALVRHLTEVWKKNLSGFYDKFMERSMSVGDPAGRMLDIGTGPGLLLIRMARRYPELRLDGFDPGKAMVEVGRDNIRREGLASRIELHEGFSEKLSFPDGSFDLVTSSCSLHHWEDFPRSLGEIFRVLRPGGGVSLSDVRRNIWGLLPKWDILAKVDPPSIRAAYTPEEMSGFLREAGFEEIRAEPNFHRRWAGVLQWMHVTARKPA